MTDADIAVFILARIADREAKARAATPGPWEDTGTVLAGVVKGYDTVATCNSSEWGNWEYTFPAEPEEAANAAHIASWDPAAVLARCAVDRQIVEELVSLEQEVRDVLALDLEAVPVELDARRAATYCIVRLLASLDADHPDYDKDWKP